MNTIKISDIIIPEEFKNSQPSEEKMAKVRKYIAEHGNLDEPVILIGNRLIDGYIRYLVAIEVGMEEVWFKRINWKRFKPQVKKESPMKYIVGKFENCEKEYTWKNKRNIPIEIGDKVLVRSKIPYEKGNFAVVVTVVDVFESDNPKLLKHKKVLKKI